MELYSVSVHKPAKKDLGQYQAILNSRMVGVTKQSNEVTSNE